ncbi:MAG: serine/threonine-protein kinase [Acidobacteriota bacterium]
MAENLSAGARIGSYEVLDRLGRGGMGAVYRARDTRLGRTVALKVLHSDDPELLRRLDREARAASALNHPNIVQIYDVGKAARQEGEHYVVMEYVEGETLRVRLERGPLPIPELLDLGAQLTDGLAKAHRAGIVHRDLKPENLVVNPDGLLKILDFGLAKVLPAPLGDLEAQETLSRHGTQAGMLLGTLEYMSPEQASGRPVDSRTDQFTVGVILCEMATGRAVFHRETPAQVLAAVIERDPEPLGRLRADAPPALEALVSRCLQKDPERRFAKTDDLASELARLAGRSRAGSAADAELVPAGAAPAVSGEVVPPLPAPPRPGTPTLYHLQKDGGRIRRYDEDELARRIRRGRLTGAELVRRDDEDEWQPLYESRVFRREVPSTGDPRDAARWRLLRALGGHFTGFFIVGVVMYSTQGHLPFWMGIWGAVLAMQTIGTLSKAWPVLLPGRRPERPLGAGTAVVVDPLPPLPPLPKPAVAPSALTREAARVRALIEQRGGRDTPRLLSEVDEIVKREAALATRQADLEEQTTDDERAAVATAASAAQASLEKASQEQDRRLFERQLDVLRRREEAITKAVRVLQRLRVRREMAEHQLKQLRLDLSRDVAVGLDVPELSSRLEFIRHEVDAREEVEEIDAATD